MRALMVILMVLISMNVLYAQEPELIFTHTGHWDYWDVGCGQLFYDAWGLDYFLRYISEDDSTNYYVNDVYWSDSVPLPEGVLFPLRDVDIGGLCDSSGQYWAMNIEFVEELICVPSTIFDAVWSGSYVNVGVDNIVVSENASTGNYDVARCFINQTGSVSNPDVFFTIETESPEFNELSIFGYDPDIGTSWKNASSLDTIFAVIDEFNPDQLPIPLLNDNIVDATLSSLYNEHSEVYALISNGDNSYDLFFEEDMIYSFESSSPPHSLTASQYPLYYHPLVAWIAYEGDHNKIIYSYDEGFDDSLIIENEIIKMKVASSGISSESGYYENYLFWSEYNSEADSTYFYRFRVEWNQNTVENQNSIISSSNFTLNNSYPNPFNGSVRISYSLSKADEVRISIFDILGRKVYSSSHELQQTGTHNYTWNADYLPSGEYILKVTAGNRQQTQTLTLIK